jgi:hypothetical protein
MNTETKQATLDEITKAVREHAEKHFNSDTCSFTDFQCDICGKRTAGWEYIEMAYTEDELQEFVKESKATTAKDAIAHIGDVMHSVADVHAERDAAFEWMWKW